MTRKILPGRGQVCSSNTNILSLFYDEFKISNSLLLLYRELILLYFKNTNRGTVAYVFISTCSLVSLCEVMFNLCLSSYTSMSIVSVLKGCNFLLFFFLQIKNIVLEITSNVGSTTKCITCIILWRVCWVLFQMPADTDVTKIPVEYRANILSVESRSTLWPLGHRKLALSLRLVTHTESGIEGQMDRYRPVDTYFMYTLM